MNMKWLARHPGRYTGHVQCVFLTDFHSVWELMKCENCRGALLWKVLGAISTILFFFRSVPCNVCVQVC